MLEEIQNAVQGVPTSRVTQTYSLEVKKKVIERALEIGVTAACREMGIQKIGTAHCWLQRYREKGWDGLVQSRRPNYQPKKTSHLDRLPILGV